MMVDDHSGTYNTGGDISHVMNKQLYRTREYSCNCGFLSLQVDCWNCRCGGMTAVISEVSFPMFFTKKSVYIVTASMNASGTVTHFTIHSHRIQPLGGRNHSTLPKRTTFYYYKGDKNDVLYIIFHH